MRASVASQVPSAGVEVGAGSMRALPSVVCHFQLSGTGSHQEENERGDVKTKNEMLTSREEEGGNQVKKRKRGKASDMRRSVKSRGIRDVGPDGKMASIKTHKCKSRREMRFDSTCEIATGRRDRRQRWLPKYRVIPERACTYPYVPLPLGK